MLRVCHFISGDLWGGAEVMVYHLLRVMKSYDALELSVVLLNEGRLAEEARKLGIRVHVVKEESFSFFQILLAVRKILTLRPVDIIHSHGYKQNILAYLVSRYIPDVRIFGTVHGMPEFYGRRKTLISRLITYCNCLVLSKCFSHIVGVSEDIKESLGREYGVNEKKVSVIHNGAETPDCQHTGENGVSFVIGSSGRLFPVKDYPFMVEIAKVVLEKEKNIRFVLAGDGPEGAKILGLIQEYGLSESFFLRGHLEDMSDFYRGLDLYLNTSIHEGIPMSVIEAMAYGLPVIAPNVGGIAEILDNGVEGYLMDDRDPTAFGEKCFWLFENKSLRKKMSNAAREKVERSFSLEKMATQYYDLYFQEANNA